LKRFMSEPGNQPDALLSLVRKSGVNSVSLIGMAKNVGKTVTFNHLVQQASSQNMRLGLTSIGRDGEKRDEVFHTPKPRIFTPAGTLLATALGSLQRSEIHIEIVQATGFFTAMGEVVLGRACEAGFVELSGPTLLSQHQVLQKLFLNYGTDLTLIDGALDRVSPAMPGLAEAVILATGAALGPSIEVVIEKTQDRINRLAIPPVEKAQLAACRQILQSSKAAIIDAEQQVSILPIDNSLLAGELLLQTVTAQTQTVVLAGAVGDKVLECLLASKRRGNVQLVIKNGTTLFCAASLWRKFIAAGGSIRVVEPIRLLAVTVNPVSPIGEKFAPQAFFDRSARELAPYPVIDVVLGCSSEAGG
jgi:hypothetical protein